MLQIIPIELSEANELVSRWHRHHQPVVGHKFSLGVEDTSDYGAGWQESGEPFKQKIVGAAIVGRPVARMLDDGWTLEVTRCVTDGTKNACSILYGACRRATFALGFKRLITYTLATEAGSSLKAAGWKLLGEAGGGSWNRKSRPRVDKAPTSQKLLWEAR